MRSRQIAKLTTRSSGASPRVACTAFVIWREERRKHLDDLLDAHKLVGGPGPGRRWRTAALNDALILRLAAGFQGFARDLHDQASDVFASWIAPSSPTAQRVVRNQLVKGRELERGNAHPGSIGRDFDRFGFEVWRELRNRDERTAKHNESLALLNDARNGLAHSDDAKLAALRARGVERRFVSACRCRCAPAWSGLTLER